MEYPAFLPCPEWQYGEGITQFEGRTLMESGWTRQRRSWHENYTAIDLTFKMSTGTFSIWMDFVNANGYSWFTIPLDRFDGEKQVKLIRFITPVQYTYGDFNYVFVAVSAELSGELPNPPKIPPVTGNGYSCSSYSDYLSGLGISYAQMATNELTDLPYPFSTNASVADGKFRYYYDFIAAGTLLTDWAPTVELSTSDISELYGPTFCGGAGLTQQITNIDGSASYGPDALVWPTGVENWGDYAVEAMITGYNGGSTISGVITRQSGKRWNVSWDGTGYTLSEPFIGVNLGTSGNDLVITASVLSSDGFGYPDLSESVTVVGKNDTVQLIQVHISSGAPYDAQWIGNANPAAECLVRDVSIRVECGGQSLTLSGVQCYGYGRSNGGNLTSTSPAEHTIYTAPHSFYTEAKLSLLSFAAGGIEDYDFSQAQIAFLENFSE